MFGWVPNVLEWLLRLTIFLGCEYCCFHVCQSKEIAIKHHAFLDFPVGIKALPWVLVNSSCRLDSNMHAGVSSQ